MAKSVKKVSTVKALRTVIRRWRRAGDTLALVPTMGSLHSGHLSLVRLAKKKCDRVVVSVFINPSQFAPGEDLARYPRDESGDHDKLLSVATDLIWAPDDEEMYGPGFAARIEPGGAALELEGAFRPHHFAGVATVCCKLFNQVAPDIAVFGEKDYQQLCVIRQMVRDLDLNLKIVAGPTVRERDGLALSSRNQYLGAEERRIAPALARIIKAAAKRATEGGRIANIETNAMRELASAGFSQVDYVAIRDAETLGPFDRKRGRKGRVLAAAWLGATRLIDNCAVR